MKNVLVTGGAGFVGSNLVRMLVQEHGCTVTVLDDLFTGAAENLEGVDAEFVHASVTDRDQVVRAVAGKDTVFHLAARNIIASMEYPRQDMEANVSGTFNILEASRDAGVQRVVYTSTASVYGNPRHLPVHEDDAPKFLNFYSASKYAAEAYAQTFYEAFGLPAVIVRYSNVYGPNQHPRNPYAGVIGKMIGWALRGEPLLVHGDGEQTRDFTYVEDACRATILAALSPKGPGEVYNVGTGVETSVNRLAQTIIDLTGSRSDIVQVDKRHIDNLRRRVMNAEKARRDLKFFPNWTLANGLRETIRWFQDAVVAHERAAVAAR